MRFPLETMGLILGFNLDGSGVHFWTRLSTRWPLGRPEGSDARPPGDSLTGVADPGCHPAVCWVAGDPPWPRGDLSVLLPCFAIVVRSYPAGLIHPNVHSFVET
jgi:hypothetical protein